MEKLEGARTALHHVVSPATAFEFAPLVLCSKWHLSLPKNFAPAHLTWAKRGQNSCHAFMPEKLLLSEWKYFSVGVCHKVCSTLDMLIFSEKNNVPICFCCPCPSWGLTPPAASISHTATCSAGQGTPTATWRLMKFWGQHFQEGFLLIKLGIVHINDNLFFITLTHLHSKIPPPFFFLHSPREEITGSYWDTLGE